MGRKKILVAVETSRAKLVAVHGKLQAEKRHRPAQGGQAAALSLCWQAAQQQAFPARARASVAEAGEAPRPEALTCPICGLRDRAHRPPVLPCPVR